MSERSVIGRSRYKTRLPSATGNPCVDGVLHRETDADREKAGPVGGPGPVAVRAAAAGSDLVLFTGLEDGVAAAGALRDEIASDPAAHPEAEEGGARGSGPRQRLR